jgi:DNA-binding GntR family transcriptional regulator
MGYSALSRRFLFSSRRTKGSDLSSVTHQYMQPLQIVGQTYQTPLTSRRQQASQRELTEAGLSDEYGVSKTPVREALVLLGHEGFVEPMPRIGHVVATFTVQDVLEVFHLRSILEAEAAGLAAERITEEGIAALLKNTNEEFALSERAHEDGFYERAYELNIEFHQLIARASGNRRLADLIKRLMEDMRRMLAFDPRFVEPQQHMEIIEALKHRDRAKAEQAMKRHMEETKSRLLDRF